MLKTIALVILAALAGVLIYADTQPESFVIMRSTTIKAPPEKIYPLITDLRGWAGWSPWEKRDPAMKRTHSGAAQGKGAIYAWEGNKDVGSGRMEITTALPSSRVVIQLDFLEPFEAHNIAEFTLEPQGETTTVSWIMYGPSPYLSKLMGLVFNMDKMVGPDFETGLANLKAAAEKS